MFARVAVWSPMPQDDRQWVIDAAKSVPGVLDAYHLVDPATGNGLSIAFFEDGGGRRRSQGRRRRKGHEIGWHDQPRPPRLRDDLPRVRRG